MLYQGEYIKKLIPQRDPIMMVDALVSVDGDVCETELAVMDNNFFIEDDQLLSEPGLIEHIAQSASAFAGYRCVVKGEPAPVGYIGEVKKFHCYRRPAIGDVLKTTVTMGAEVNGITIITGVTNVNGEVVADTQMKIFTADE
ncbi:MAG: beta-hydroxyacyl-ACP dehydratase [Bacteroidales bacterium]|nr:beta-hydroxyacyl-ACP dehydratase [Bacteroidales bacterium]